MYKKMKNFYKKLLTKYVLRCIITLSYNNSYLNFLDSICVIGSRFESEVFMVSQNDFLHNLSTEQIKFLKSSYKKFQKATGNSRITFCSYCDGLIIFLLRTYISRGIYGLKTLSR